MNQRSFTYLAGSMALLAALALGLRPGGAQAQIARLGHADTTAGNFFGVAVSLDGDRALVGASAENVCGENSGAAYVYERDPQSGAWREAARLSPTDCTPGYFFGRALSLSGDRAIIAAAEYFFASGNANAAYIFERDSTGAWTERQKLTADPRYEEGAFASSVSIDGDRVLVTTSGDPTGERYGGAAYVYEPNPRTGLWEMAAHLTAAEGVRYGIMGGSGVLQGNRIAVAASKYFKNQPGSVYVFELPEGAARWRQAARLGGIDEVIISMDLDGDRLLVGESKGGRKQSGLATIFSRDASGAWREAEVIAPRYPYDYGAFGKTVSLSGDRALITGYDEQLGLDFNIDRVVYLYVRNPETGQWEQERVIDVGEVAFGASLDHEGDIGIIGAASEKTPGSAYIVGLPVAMSLAP